MNCGDKGARVLIQTLAGSSPDGLIRGADVKRVARIDRSQIEDLVDVLGDLTEALFALTQCRGPLQDLFSERAIPRDQASDKQDSYRRRIACISEVTPIPIDRAAKPFLIDLLQLAWFDSCEARRHCAQQGRIP